MQLQEWTEEGLPVTTREWMKKQQKLGERQQSFEGDYLEGVVLEQGFLTPSLLRSGAR